MRALELKTNETIDIRHMFSSIINTFQVKKP